MIQKITFPLMAMIVLTTARAVSAQVNNSKTTGAVRERAELALTKKAVVSLRVRKGAKVLVGAMRFKSEVSRTSSFSGRIRETRAVDFTLVSGKPGVDEFELIINYDDVVGLEQKSALKKISTGAGRILFGIGAGSMLLPAYPVLKLLGKLPQC